MNSFVAQLCNKIVPNAWPIRIPVRPECDAVKNECFPNVHRKIARSGGSIQHGWAIAERPGLVIEAQFHGVWIDLNGAFVDVTPTQSGETETLFLPDPKEVFDENALVRRINIRLAEYDHHLIHEYLSHAEALSRYEERCTHPSNPKRMIVDPDIYGSMLSKVAKLELQMLSLVPRRNSSCRCGSGNKFKHCCGGRAVRCKFRSR